MDVALPLRRGENWPQRPVPAGSFRTDKPNADVIHISTMVLRDYEYYSYPNQGDVILRDVCWVVSLRKRYSCIELS